MIPYPNIFILDDDTEVLQVFRDWLTQRIAGANVVTFSNVEDFLNYEELELADLFIIDIVLPGSDGRKVVRQLPVACKYTPILFVSGYSVNETLFRELDSLYVFDFIEKPTSMRTLENRARLLLSFKMRYSSLSSDVLDADKSLITLFDLTPFLAVVLDSKMNVRYCNRQLIDFLGADPEQVIGKDWHDFLPSEAINTVEEVHKSVLDAAPASAYKDFENEVVKVDGTKQLVKWFNTQFKGGTDSLTLSIGVPVSFKHSSSPEQFRAYWMRELVTTKAMIRAFRLRAAESDKTQPQPSDVCRMEAS